MLELLAYLSPAWRDEALKLAALPDSRSKDLAMIPTQY